MNVLLPALLFGFHAPSERVPRFEDYRVSAIYRGKTVAPNFGNRSPKGLRRDLLRIFDIPRFPWKWEMDDVPHRRVDYAGHYVFVHGSAGGNSAMFNIVDAKTGLIHGIEYEMKVLSKWQYAHQADRRPNSRLVILHGWLFDESQSLPDLPFGDHYFVCTGRKFAYLGSVPLFKPVKPKRGVHVLAVYQNVSSRTLQGRSGSHTYAVTLTSKPFDGKTHKIEVTVDGKQWPVPKSIWLDCFNVLLGEWPGANGRPAFQTPIVKLSNDGRTMKVITRSTAPQYADDYSETQIVWGLNAKGEDYCKFDGD